METQNIHPVRSRNLDGPPTFFRDTFCRVTCQVFGTATRAGHLNQVNEKPKTHN